MQHVNDFSRLTLAVHGNEITFFIMGDEEDSRTISNSALGFIMDGATEVHVVVHLRKSFLAVRSRREYFHVETDAIKVLLRCGVQFRKDKAKCFDFIIQVTGYCVHTLLSVQQHVTERVALLRLFGTTNPGCDQRTGSATKPQVFDKAGLLLGAPFQAALEIRDVKAKLRTFAQLRNFLGLKLGGAGQHFSNCHSRHTASHAVFGNLANQIVTSAFFVFVNHFCHLAAPYKTTTEKTRRTFCNLSTAFSARIDSYSRQYSAASATADTQSCGSVLCTEM